MNTVVLLLLLSMGLRGQDTLSALGLFTDQYKIEASVGLQLWSTYGYGMRVINQDGAPTAVDPRFNTQLRRSRFTLKGDPYPTLRFKITASLDLVGHDVLSSTESGGNNGGSPSFRIWNAWIDWRRKPDDDRFHFVAGYFAPPIGRESTASALASTSFEKAWSQNYLRRHLTNTGPGRAAGLMLAGLLHARGNRRHLSYELALQNPLFSYDGNSSGLAYSPLVTARLAFQLGDAEQATYRPDKRVNYFGKRRGITLALAGARQGGTDRFTKNTAYGVDVLVNHGPWQIDGELLRLGRVTPTSTGTPVRVTGHTGYLRVGRNLLLPRKLTLEPVVSYWWYRGGTSAEAIAAARVAASFAGRDSGLDVGGNLYLSPRAKLSLFWALRRGSSGAGTPAEVDNNFFRQSGIGVIERGSYLGLGWVSIF